MKPLDLQSEPYSNLGNISAKGIGKILGTPRHDRLQIVVRETVQNSWDARAPGAGPTYKLRIRTLTPEQQRVLQDEVFAELPPDAEEAAPIRQALTGERVVVLEIADFNTCGLGGPVRADVVEEHEATDFVDFMRNIGSPRDTELGGGTYGYGKTSLYAMSECRTVLVHSRTRHHGHATDRLMGCRLGDPFTVTEGAAKGRYTGRHWWGRQSGAVVDPLADEEVRQVADRLGLFARQEHDFGTTLLMLCPVLEGRSMRQAANAAVESLLWFFWPKMVKHPAAPMRFEVLLEDERLDIPRLSDCPPLDLFEQAMLNLKEEEEVWTSEVWCGRPRQKLGMLSLMKGARGPRRTFDTGPEVAPLFPAESHHVALMRPAELVVKYQTGPALPSTLFEYGGVFICDDDVEPAFAAAEPPAHDDWVPDYLTGHDKTFVRMAYKRIQEKLHAFAQARARNDQASGTGRSFGMLGDALGDLLIGAGGERLGGMRPSPGGSSPKKNLAVRGPATAGFSVHDGDECALFDVAVESATDADVVLQSKPAVVLFDGSAEDSAEGRRPEVKAWLSEDGDVIGQGAELQMALKAKTEVRFKVAVSLPGECKVKLTVSANQKNSDEQR